MKEAQLNRDLVSLFKKTDHFSYKIPDPSQAEALSSAKRPFDGFARFSEPVNDFWFESKLIKNKVSAFALDRVAEHQYSSLLQIKHSGGFTAIILGVWIPRTEYWFMCFDPEFLFSLLKSGKKSISKKELNFYCEKGYSISLRSKDLSRFLPSMLKDKLVNFLPSREAVIGKV